MEHQTSMAHFRRFLADWVNHAAYGHARIVVQRRGQIFGALVGPRDLQLLRNHSDPAHAQPHYDSAPIPRSAVRASNRVYRERWHHTLAMCLPEHQRKDYLASVGIHVGPDGPGQAGPAHAAPSRSDPASR